MRKACSDACALLSLVFGFLTFVAKCRLVVPVPNAKGGWPERKFTWSYKRANRRCEDSVAVDHPRRRSVDQLRFGALRAPFPARGILRSTPDRSFFTKPNTSRINRSASVARLRRWSGSSRIAVRLPSGISVRLRRESSVRPSLRAKPRCGPTGLTTSLRDRFVQSAGWAPQSQGLSPMRASK